MKIIRELSCPPDNPAFSDCYYDATLKKMRIYNGVTWGTLGASKEEHEQELIQVQFDRDLKEILDGSE